MPYINQGKRSCIDPATDNLVEMFHHEHIMEGDLNYIITKLVLAWARNRRLDYATISAVTGVLKNVSDEFYRRVAVPYEEKRREENGDVY